ncbi:BON domain-containing protein [Pseudoduganella namucuonensis]|uniref:BON domain-containing protein n=1 Tax=Pseudoduganella namucuonensis TaxID=1035707 RepID=A0A1I7FGC7_9BURK|nr:BON domain-containing protein [Pseudoduganella namucuonensis]SFU35241.1 BON domain-containing protein [Pseudoduganella namucuonensis]
MNKFIILALAGAIGTAYAADNDKAAYDAMRDKATSEYKVAKEKCDSLKKNAKDVCQEEAKVARAKAEADAVAMHKATPNAIRKAREDVADAEYELAKEKCDDLSGSAKSTCKSEAKAAKSTAIAELRGTTGTTPAIAVVDNATGKTVASAGVAGPNDRTVGDRTAAATDTVRDKTVAAADTARDKTRDAGDAMSDTVITTKVKADLAADPGVKALDVHVETVKGVVMLSGFVPSKAEADKAVQLARNVKGVAEVKSSIQVKK